ncbi:MAG: hypothetical protein QM330_10795, partial [Acidobacteriota bacterium]|nr:hypothetical protein [Acidobacteriota bacterium]
MDEKVTSEQKREARFARWLDAPGVHFDNPAAQKAYRDRVTRFIRVFSLEKPDRVPLVLPAGNFPIYHAGFTLKEAMEDNGKLCAAFRKFLREFESDTFASPMMVPSAAAGTIIRTVNTRWPGYGLPDTASMLQFVEGEYMKADDYDLFLEDLTDFCLRRYLPRSLGALAPFADFPPPPINLGVPNRFRTPPRAPEVRAGDQAHRGFGAGSARGREPGQEVHRGALAAGDP